LEDGEGAPVAGSQSIMFDYGVCQTDQRVLNVALFRTLWSDRGRHGTGLGNEVRHCLMGSTCLLHSQFLRLSVSHASTL